MSNYTRSRAKMYRDEPADRGGYYQQRGSGNGRGYVLFIGGAVVIVVLVIAIVFMFKSCSEDTSAPPAVSPSDMGVWTPTPTESPTIAPTDTTGATNAAVSASASASATSELTETSTPEATASPTAEVSSTATPKPTSGSGEDDKSAITPGEIKGKPDVNEYLPLRKSASSTAEELGKIQKDEEFTILQVNTNKSWLKVKYNDKTGYVLAKYVTVGSGESDKVCTITTDTLNVRSGAGKTKTIVGTLKSGDTVIVTDTVTAAGEKWYKIKAGDKEGYVFATNCRLGS